MNQVLLGLFAEAHPNLGILFKVSDFLPTIIQPAEFFFILHGWRENHQTEMQSEIRNSQAVCVFH